MVKLIQHQQFKELKKLITSHGEDYYKNTICHPLHVIAKYSNIEPAKPGHSEDKSQRRLVNLLEILANKGLDINQVDYNTITPLSYAVHNSTVVMNWLITYGADINAIIGQQGQTALMTLLDSYHALTEIVESSRLSRSTTLMFRSKLKACRELCCALTIELYSGIKITVHKESYIYRLFLILNQKHNLEVEDSYGLNLLDHAISFVYSLTLRVSDSLSSTFKFSTCRENSFDIREIGYHAFHCILSQYGDVDVVKMNGFSPLMSVATSIDDGTLVAMLIKAGANMDLKLKHGADDALSLALEYKNITVALVLALAGSDLYSASKWLVNSTPIDFNSVLRPIESMRKDRQKIVTQLHEYLLDNIRKPSTLCILCRKAVVKYLKNPNSVKKLDVIPKSIKEFLQFPEFANIL